MQTDRAPGRSVTVDSIPRLNSWVERRTWGASREYLLAHPDLLDQPRPASGAAGPRDPADVAPGWLKLLRRAREIGVDAAYGELLAPWFMIYISRELATKITAAGELSPAMFGLFSEHHEIMPVLPYCKKLRAESVETLLKEGADYAEQTLLSLAHLSDPDRSVKIVGNLATYESLFTLDEFSYLVSMVIGLHALRFERDEAIAFRHLNNILGSQDPSVQRLRAITADYVGLFYKNSRSIDSCSNRKKH